MYVILVLFLFFAMLVIYQVFAPTMGFPSLTSTKPTAIDPNSLSHHSILDILKKLGHPEFSGVCFGFTVNWAQAVAKNQEDFFYNQIRLLRVHQTQLPSIIEQIEEKRREGKLLTSDEECIETLPDLLKRICIAQDPLEYRKTYGKLVWQSDINPILETITPLPSNVRQIFFKTHTFSSRQNAIDYFNQLIQFGINGEIAVIISTADHAMGFKRADTKWRFININDLFEQNSTLPYFEFTSQELVKELYRVSTNGTLTRRLTVNTDFIAIQNKEYQQLLKPLEHMFPVFPIAPKTKYSEKVSFFAMAALQGDIPTVKQCMKSGLSIFSNHQMNDHSPIVTAIRMGRREVVRAMMSSIKHRINYKNRKDLSTLLHTACDYGHSGIVEDLLNIPGVTIDARDRDGLTPLMRACGSTMAASEKKIFQLLLGRNASLSTTDNEGFTALDHAKSIQNEIAIDLIEAKQSHTLSKTKPVPAPYSFTFPGFSFFSGQKTQSKDPGSQALAKLDL